MGDMVEAVLDRVGAPGTLAAALAAGAAALARWGIVPERAGDAGAFFAASERAQAVLRQEGAGRVADEIAFHTGYLARQRPLGDPGALGRCQQPDDAPAREAIWNIASLLRGAPQPPAMVQAAGLASGLASGLAPAVARVEGLPADVFAVIEAAELALEGWCSRDKARALAMLVLRERPELCVEIGLYGGRSLMPCAAALRANGSGRIYGIECWSAAPAIEHPTSGDNDAWWQAVDFPRIKRAFFRFMVAQDLSAQICILQTSARRAAAAFDAIDFLHIDGGHSVIGAAEDVLLYATKVRPGGIIVFDDTNWETTLPAQHLLTALAQPLMTQHQVNEAQYAIFRRH
jgi:predicted O-methyltransferase YrrM